LAVFNNKVDYLYKLSNTKKTLVCDFFNVIYDYFNRGPDREKQLKKDLQYQALNEMINNEELSIDIRLKIFTTLIDVKYLFTTNFTIPRYPISCSDNPNEYPVNSVIIKNIKHTYGRASDSYTFTLSINDNDETNQLDINPRFIHCYDHRCGINNNDINKCIQTNCFYLQGLLNILITDHTITMSNVFDCWNTIHRIPELVYTFIKLSVSAF
jgi:hypothetical protein